MTERTKKLNPRTKRNAILFTALMLIASPALSFDVVWYAVGQSVGQSQGQAQCDSDVKKKDSTIAELRAKLEKKERELEDLKIYISAQDKVMEKMRKGRHERQ